MEDINKYKCIHLADQRGNDKLCRALERVKELEDENKFYKYRYSELRKQWSRIVHALLGESYYNDGCDTYSCDEFTVDDLIYKYKKRWWQFWKKK